MAKIMDVFDVHKNIMSDYKEFVTSFINIKDPDIKQKIEEQIQKGKFWPEPLIQFNPSFKEGDTIKDLCDREILHRDINNVFSGFELFKHQSEALIKGAKKEEYVITSGTGSGKSLAFIGTIFDYLFKNKTDMGIKAIFVYPMNALINSQYEEIDKFKQNYEKNTSNQFPITFAKYTGQEKDAERKQVREELPDIILTNYMMLELILTRTQEYEIRDSIYGNLKYLVFDELHTYRGRQGSDVAMLIRRIKAQSENKISCIGTSATMVSGGTVEEQISAIANFATKIFGSSFSTNNIINEELKRCFNFSGKIPSGKTLISALESDIHLDAGEEKLKHNLLCSWLENTIALTEKDGILFRNKPQTLKEIVSTLSKETTLSEDICEEKIKQLLLWISHINKNLENNKYSYLPYKIYQFISQTGSVYISLSKGDFKEVSLEPLNHKIINGEKIPFFPVVFSRVSGEEFICVNIDRNEKILRPREFNEIDDEDENIESGYIIPNIEAWNPESDYELLPDSYGKFNKNGEYKPLQKYKDKLPQKIYYDKHGNYSTTERLEYEGWFMATKLLFDPTCGIFYDFRTSEATKLTRLGSEGRSTSTTTLAFSIIHHFAENDFENKDQKVLSFTDNRQDAALQAGHFNDFIRVTRIRSALYQALKEKKMLNHSNIDQAVYDSLKLSQNEYANLVSDIPSVMRDNEQALKDYLMYLILWDLRHSWKVILPNLEQCKLLKIEYNHLKENCEYKELWKDVPHLNNYTQEERINIIYQVLDYFRKSYAIRSENYLTYRAINEKIKVITEKLKEPWKFNEKEKISEPNFLRYETLKQSHRKLFTSSLGSNSALGKFLKNELIIKNEEYQEFIKILLRQMHKAGWLYEISSKNKSDNDTFLYQINIDQIIWQLGDEKNLNFDVVKNRSYKTIEKKPNKFFQNIYKTDFSKIKTIIGKEHTGQLNNDDRKEREDKFRTGEYSALFCSPTMELGIDISSLNVVHMRNVPPNPANFVQRSGRAGRSGQAALVFTSCSSFSPHDRHYFNHSVDMVAGIVKPPKIDLTNRELLESHLNAICLSKAHITSLKTSMVDIIDISNNEKLEIFNDVKERLNLSNSTKEEIKGLFLKIVDYFKNSHDEKPDWLNDDWIGATINGFSNEFDRSLERWRRLYRNAQDQINNAVEIIKSGIYTQYSYEMKEANRNLKQGVVQRILLINENKGSLSEFYPFRYLASEGFIPGYNFTRLPIRSFIPIGDSGDYISRPRFIALNEFGPMNIIYHNGSKFRIRQMLVSKIEDKLKKGKLCNKSGYFLMDAEYDCSVCPFTNTPLDDNKNVTHFVDLIEMVESRTVQMERISCEEEERLSKGYDIKTYFNVPGGIDTIKVVKIYNEKDHFLNIRYIPASRIIQINKKWKISKEAGFSIGLNSGLWKSAGTSNTTNSAEDHRMVHLFTYDTADSLYIEPIKSLALKPNGIVTLQYAIKRGIESVFQVEPREIGAILIGDEENPNILIYEASEGSLGILSQFVEDKNVFQNVISETIKICRYDDKDYKDYASYDDLLSYYNQKYHDVINRFDIEDALNKLKSCSAEIITSNTGKDCNQQYNDLLKQIDPNSSTELKFIKFLFNNGLKLPDKAQEQTEGIYSQPDFFYEPNIWVFCDGTPHDKQEIRERDNDIREAIRNRGEQVFVYYYKDNLKEIISKRPDIFKKVK